MKKKTIILSQKQIDEICGDNFAFDYLDGSDTDLSGYDHGNEASLGKGVNGEYPETMDTDDYAETLSPELPLYLNPSGGKSPVGNIAVGSIREMKKSEFEKLALLENDNEKEAHGNQRLKNRVFGSSNGPNAPKYGESELTQQLYRDREALKNARSSDPETRKKGIESLQRIAKNRAVDGKTVAMQQYKSAKMADKVNNGNKIKSAPKITGNGKAHTKNTNNGIITM